MHANRLRFTIFSTAPIHPFALKAAFGGAEEAAREVFQSRLGRGAGALASHVCGVSDTVDGIGVVLHTEPVRPVLNNAERRELLV
jgi:hypothetical protein